MAKHVTTKADLEKQAEKVEEALRELKRAETAADQATAKGRRRALKAVDDAIKKAEEEVGVYRWLEAFYRFRGGERRRARGRATKGRHKR